MNKNFYERQIKRLEYKLKEFYQDDYTKTKHYFREKGFIEGVLYAYKNIVDELEEHENKIN